MKKITLLMTLLVSFAGFAQFPAPYCGPMTFTSAVEPITSVNFAGILNTSSALVGTDNGTTRIAHENYTAIVGNVTAGSTYPITLKGNTDGPTFTTNLRVYVDWNQNNDFTDAGESYDIGTITGSTGVDAIELTGNILVPTTALAGTTRMRIVKRFNGYGTSCQTGTGYGQTEDYSLAVTIPNCLAPSAGLATVTSSTTANLSWTSGGAANAEIVVQVAGAGVPALANDTGVNVSGSTYSAGLLLAQTAYEFYVRDECVLGSGFSTWSGPFLFNTTQIPGCATNLTPLDGATGVATGTVTFSWNAPTTGDAPTSYDLFYGLTPGNATILVGNYTTLTTPITITGFNTTFYWKIVPKNISGSATGCPEWSFTTGAAPGFCLTAPAGQWPAATITPETCDGIFSNLITANGYAGEFSVVSVTSGQTYTFTSSVATDLITISADGGATAAAFGTTPVTWVSTIDGTIRFYNHTNDQCGTESVNRTRSVICGIPSTDAPDYVNLKFPASATINQGGSVTVYGEVYEGGLTDLTSGQAQGINAWVGISPIGSNSNPNTWTTWIPATFNVETENFPGSGNFYNDEYQASIGATLVPGTYYYATRFQLNNGVYVYGGIDSSNNGSFWNGTGFNSGVLTVSPPPAPANDLCADAVNVTCGSTTAGTTLNATNENSVVCGISGVTAQNTPGVWYKFVGDGSDVTVTTCSSTITTGDSRIAVYSGSCGTLTCIGGNDDAQAAGCASNTLSSVVTFSSVVGTDYYILVYSYTFAVGTNPINFELSVSCVAACSPVTNNDDCATASPITVGTTATASDNLCSSPSLDVAYPTCGNQFGTYYDTWYSFNANAADMTVNLGNTTGTTGFALYSGTCGALTMVVGSCSTLEGTVSVTGLTVGVTYYVRVFSTSPTARGSFNLTVSQTLATGSFDASNFSYYPNPVKNILNLSYNQEISNVEVFNLLGQKVISNVINANDTEINMSGLPNGAYMVKVTSNNQVKTIKVIKE
jgi:hypothetical protein